MTAKTFFMDGLNGATKLNETILHVFPFYFMDIVWHL